jgi:ATP diphosphatase
VLLRGAYDHKGIVDELSILANISVGMTPLIRAQKLQKKSATVGFDWPDIGPVMDKIQDPDQQAIEEEIGDLLFAFNKPRCLIAWFIFI